MRKGKSVWVSYHQKVRKKPLARIQKFPNVAYAIKGNKNLVYLLCVFLFISVFSACRKSVTLDKESAEEKKDQSAYTEQERTNTIQFSGQTWYVKNTSSTAGPGNNYWSKNNVWVDNSGRLHLKISKDSRGRWQCAEVYTKKSFGYGKYQWWIEGRIDQLDKNVVFGLFNYSGNDQYDEMDIEYARWGSKLNNNLNYTVYPASSNSTGKKWTKTKNILLNGSYTTQRFTRTSTSVKFQSLHGFYNSNKNEYFTKTCSNGLVSKTKMPIHINLWLFNGTVPSNKKEIEIIIHSFKYTQ